MGINYPSPIVGQFLSVTLEDFHQFTSDPVQFSCMRVTALSSICSGTFFAKSSHADAGTEANRDRQYNEGGGYGSGSGTGGTASYIPGVPLLPRMQG